MAGNLPKVGVEMVAENSAPFLKAIGDGDKAVRSFGQTAVATGPNFNSFEQIATGALRRVGELAINVSLEAGKALLGFGADSITLAGDYEATLNRFSSVTGSSLADAGYEVEDFSKLFLKLGADTQFSAQQAADAGVELAKGGVPIEQIMGDATEATLALSAAGELELAPAAAIVAKQLGVWGDTGVTATDAANLLAQAANASTVDVDELALGMANVGGTAKVAGVSFQETVQAMALLAPGFSSAADAGTSFKTFLTKLIPKTKDEVGMMQQLGLYTEETGSVFYDTAGNFIGMEKASDLLADATDHLSEEQKLLAFHTIFGADAIRAAAIISEQGAEGFNAMGESMTNAGTASAQAAERNKGFNFAMESLKGSIETIQIILGTLLLPTLTSFINDVIIPGSNAVMSFATALGESGDPMGMLSGLAASAVQNIAGAIPAIRQAFLDWALAAADWVLDSMPMLLANLGTFLQGAISWGVQNAVVFGEQMLAFGQQLVAWIAPRLPELANQLGQFLNTMVNWVVASLPAWGEQLGQLGMKAIQWVQDALPGLATNLGQFAGNLLAWIVKTAGDVVPKLAELASKFVLWVITDVLPELPNTVLKIAEALNTFISETAAKVVPALKEVGQKFLDWITVDVLPYLPAGLARVWDELEAWAKNTARDVVAKVKEIGSAIVDGIIAGAGSLARQLYDSLVGSISGAIDEAKAFFGIHSPSDYTYAEIGVWILPGIERAIVDTTPALTNTLVSSLSATMDAGISIARDGGAMIGETFAGAVGDTASQVAAFQAAMGSVRPAQGGLGEFGSGGGHRIQPVMTPSQIGGQMSITNNGPQISYAPTYHTNAPPPALDFGTLQALTGGL